MLKNKWIVFGAAALMFAACAADASAQQRGGGRPSFDRLLEAFDADGDEALASGEVPGRVWTRLSQADADGDGAVTRGEFDGYRPSGKP